MPKVDGYRMLAYKAGPRVQLLSRHGVDHSRRYPDVAVAVAALPASSVVLDGEPAVFDKQLRSRFDWLRHRQPPDIAMTPTPRQMGKTLRRIRKDKGISQTALAEKAGLSREYVNKIEAGRYDPPLSTINALARALRVRGGGAAGVISEAADAGYTAAAGLSRASRDNAATPAAEGRKPRWRFDTAMARTTSPHAARRCQTTRSSSRCSTPIVASTRTRAR